MSATPAGPILPVRKTPAPSVLHELEEKFEEGTRWCHIVADQTRTLCGLPLVRCDIGAAHTTRAEPGRCPGCGVDRCPDCVYTARNS